MIFAVIALCFGAAGVQRTRTADAAHTTTSSYIIFFKGSEDNKTLDYTLTIYGQDSPGGQSYAEEFGSKEPSGEGLTPGGFNIPSSATTTARVTSGFIGVVNVTQPLYAGDTINIIWTTHDNAKGPRFGVYAITGPKGTELFTANQTDNTVDGMGPVTKYTLPTTPGSYIIAARDLSGGHEANQNNGMGGDMLYACKFRVVAPTNTVGGKTLENHVSSSVSSFIYDGSLRNALASVSSYVTYTGGADRATNVGTYTVKVKPRMKYSWSNGGKEERTFTWKITQAQQPATGFSNAGTVTMGSKLTLGLNAAVQGGASVTYKITNDTGAATLSGNTLTPTKAGTVTVTATIGATQNYAGKTLTQTITINKASQNITLSPTSLQTFTLGKFVLSGAAGAVTFSSSDNSVVKVSSDGSYEVVGEGSATITVTAAAYATRARAAL